MTPRQLTGHLSRLLAFLVSQYKKAEARLALSVTESLNAVLVAATRREQVVLVRPCRPVWSCRGHRSESDRANEEEDDEIQEVGLTGGIEMARELSASMSTLLTLSGDEDESMEEGQAQRTVNLAG
ncbi:unnamed protein product, partial [Protopolystoma xenopodis]